MSANNKVIMMAARRTNKNEPHVGANELNERKKAEDEVKKSESVFHSVWDNSFDAMRLMNRDGIMVGVNDAFCNMFRKKREELIDQHFTVIHENPDKDTM
mgnify:CR=1 FL=1